jgi:hypothetical protein
MEAQVEHLGSYGTAIKSNDGELLLSRASTSRAAWWLEGCGRAWPIDGRFVVAIDEAAFMVFGAHAPGKQRRI